MSGMTLKPANVGNHRTAVGLVALHDLTPNVHARTTQLIVKPGTKILANVCQTNVSSANIPARFVSFVSTYDFEALS